MKKIFASLAVVPLLIACAEDQTVTGPESEPQQPAPSEEVVTLSHMPLTALPASQSRIVYAPQTRTLETSGISLYATLENPSKTEGAIRGFIREEEGRYLSATGIAFDGETFYVTYHMQGNNYNTQQEKEVSGFIETFTFGENGEVIPGNIYLPDDPNVNIDFNHIYFDDAAKDTGNDGSGYGPSSDVHEDRLIFVGHKSENSDKNTAAIIGRLNLEGSSASLDYATVLTGDKLLDETGHSLGDEDAADANCVLRAYNWYYIATRKGLAVVDATLDNLFAPAKDWEGNTNFIRTPGSMKYLYSKGQYSNFSCIYLDGDTPEGFTYDTALPAKLAHFHVDPGAGKGVLGSTKNAQNVISNVKAFDIADYDDQSDLPNYVSPVDGKNVLFMPEGSEYYACLGTGGLYVKNSSSWPSGVVKFGDSENGKGRPVNGVFVDQPGNDQGGEYHNGFVHVANGRCLTILNRNKLEQVAEYSAPITEEASANFVYVVTGEMDKEQRRAERTIIVAYGQAGVKIFKFMPPTYW